MQYQTPGKVPAVLGVEPRRGCPYDCGLCTEHEQHTCVGLLEITSSCNLTCPMCFAASGPGGTHLSVEDCRRAIDRLVEAEGRPEVLQLSGGEPTIHPKFFDILAYACERPIDVVMINTNGVRFAKDEKFLARVAEWKHRLEIYFQCDGLRETPNLRLRGASLLETKLQALEKLGAAGLRTTLVCTLQAGVNEDQIGPLVEFALARPWITGVSFQPATYVGRHFLPEQLESRITFPDIPRGVAEQTGGLFRESDFTPLPCAHPNAHSLAYAYRSGGEAVPLARFIDLEQHLDLLAGGITFNRPRARALIEQFLARCCCGSGGCATEPRANAPPVAEVARLPAAVGGEAGTLASPATENAKGRGGARLAEEFFRKALTENLAPADVLRVTTTSFMDAYNFDVRQLMKSCVHHILPSGHIIPFSAYNVLYRDGHVPLPALRTK
jgi:uncharacterized radical SAM superfamily Fe-S cluster-containing enzyme